MTRSPDLSKHLPNGRSACCGHAEIAGGGIAGLAAAAALAQRGWSVRVHERADQIRASGSGIYIAENGLRTLEAIGASEEALDGGYRFFRREIRNEKGKVLSADNWSPDGGPRIHVLRRETLMKALLNVALQAGVEIRHGSRVRSAHPDGTLKLEGAEDLHADLIIGADGVHSTVRENLGIKGSKTPFSYGATRAIVPRGDDSHLLPPHNYMEVWNGSRRFFYAPISDSEVYVVLMADARDREGRSEPPNIATWQASFPQLKDVLDRVRNHIPWAPFVEVKLDRWSSGKVALIGDAAHAMPPNLGQGGGTAMMDAISLAHHVSRSGDLTARLVAWEASQRSAVDRVQLVSKLYGSFTTWPPTLRRIAFGILGKNGWVRQQRYIATNFIPDGVDDAPELLENRRAKQLSIS